MHVHREQLDGRLLLGREALEPAFERVLAAALADPHRLAGLQVADDGDELVVERVASSEPLLVHADLAQGHGGPRRLPALDGALLGATDGQPAQAVQRGDVHHGHRRGLHGEPLLKAARLSLVGIGPRDHLDGRGVAARTLARARARTAAPSSAPPTTGRPIAEGQPLVNVAAGTPALPAPGRPPALDDEHQPRLADQSRSLPTGRTRSPAADSKNASVTFHPSKPRNLCQNPSRAAPFPSLRFPCRNPRDGRRMVRCRVGQRFLNQAARHGARSSGSCRASRERAPRRAHATRARSRCPHLRRRADDPQVCVDWCDAHAYCAAFGKHLCRGIWMSSGNATQDEWYNACSRNGALAFPYGQSFVAGVCNDFSKTYPALTTLPVGSLPGCVGGFPGLFDMSGNAAEWTDSCSGATGASDSCAVRGGSFANTDMDLSCLVAGAQVRSVTSPYFGFRCCL